jgi:hypothetical protein
MSNHPDPHHEGHHFDVSNAEGRFQWFFKEFWPIILPGSCFLLMCAIPLTLSGMLHNYFSASDVVWGGYGLLLIVEFLVAVAIVCLLPHLLGVYLLLLAIYGLVLAESGNAWTVGFLSDGHNTWMINSISILFLTYVAIGNLVFLNVLRNQRKSRL